MSHTATTLSPEQLLERLQVHVGPLLLGVLIHALLSGGVLVQVFHFFSWTEKESVQLKGLIIFIGVTTFAAVALNQMYLFQLLIQGFGNYGVAFGKDLPAAAVSFVVMAIHETIAQGFFSLRLWRLSHNVPLAIVTCCGMILCFSSTIAVISVINGAGGDKRWAYVSDLLEIASWAACCTDLIICGAFALKLRRMQTGFNTVTDIVVSKVVRMSLLMCLGTTSMAFAGAVAARTQGSVANYQRFFAYVKAPLYVASVLYALNSRRDLRQTGLVTVNPNQHASLPRGMVTSRFDVTVVQSPRMASVEIPVYLGDLGRIPTNSGDGAVSEAGGSEDGQGTGTEKVAMMPSVSHPK